MKRIGLACLVVVAAANGAIADTLADCSQGRNSDVRLRACSDVIAGPAYGPDEKALAYRNRGNARADAGASAQAVADFNQAIRLRPNDASGYAGRARAKLALRDVAAAIDDYDAALRLTPTTPATASLYVGRGHARFVKGDLTAAIADFTEAIRLNPNSPSAFNRRGLAYRRSGDLARAIDDYTAAIALNPVYALAYNNRGYVYEAQGRKQDAIADFQSALLLDPSLIGARDGLARLGIPAALLAETEKRVQEGKALVEQPLMRNVLADLALESEAATSLAIRVARAVDASARDARERALARIVTAVGKYWVCKRCPPFVAEALECLGGNGYVEDFNLARLFRQSPLNSIWEGSGNIQCLDVLRALRKEPSSADAFFGSFAS
jgi:tetratricopeptide (TPR) repeat protein